MNVTFLKSCAVGSVSAPPSKSAAHRLLICGALSGGSRIDNIAFSKDITATLGCLEKMGARVEKSKNSVYIGKLNPFNIKDGAHLDCNESGSTLRFLLPLCMLANKTVYLNGSERLFSRPLDIYEKICREENIIFQKMKTELAVTGKLHGGDYTLPGDVSSQFITGLLLTLPLLDTDSIVTVTGNFESESYVNLTLDAMRIFGVNPTRKGNTFYIEKNSHYTAQNVTVEGDCSNAAFLDAFNLLGGNVTVTGLREDTLQGDYIYKKMFSELKNGHREFDLSDCPDLAPVMFAMSAVSGGAHFLGTRRLKIKESDRGEAMKAELAKFGIDVLINDNDITVKHGTPHTPTVPLCGHNDHRIVMALSLLCSIYGGRIEGAEAVSKSFPDFFSQIEKLGIGIISDDT